jgi:ubiquitin carboxyl-terminal hydrolase 1
MNSHDEHMKDWYGHNSAYEYHQDYHDNSLQWPKFLSLGLPASLLLIGLVYSGLHALDYNLLPLQELLWNCLVYATPTRLLYILDNDLKQRAMADPNFRRIPQTHAAKSAVMRRILGFDKPGGIISTVTEAGRRRLSIIPGINIGTQGEDGRPPGLGNWDNSCYQNSVLQGLASLDTMPSYLLDPRLPIDKKDYTEDIEESADMKMSDSLRGLIARLKNPMNNGKRIWTPATLKSMSSWQQQDAQEYFSKVLDEIDKEISKAAKAANISQGLESNDGDDIPEKMQRLSGVDWQPQSSIIRNPLEGLLAQRVGCTRCGFSEGLSMIPFNCLTVPVGKSWAYDISNCFDEYTKLELIEGVECGKCTLLKTQRLLGILMERTKDSPSDDDIRQTTSARLQTVTEALEDDDYEDKTLTQKCKILPKNRVTTTKSRQAVIARPPKSLAVHVNRSLFDEMTGELKKNYAEVRFPRTLDLGPWCLGSSGTSNEFHFEEWLLDPGQSMIAGSELPSRVRGPIYELRAVVTHYGRHENGHYICYRRHPVHTVDNEKDVRQEQWWRLSDDDVMKVSEENVLGQGGVFMLFYDLVEPATLNPPKLPITDAFAAKSEMPGDIVLAANTPLPTDSDDDLTSSDGDGSSVRMSRENSIATTISERGEDNTYHPVKAVLVPPYIPSNSSYHIEESEEHGIRAPGGNMVMV